MFLLSLNACGHKAPPYYVEEKSVDIDENVELILKTKNENSEVKND
jgi:predicted small lipoprotein YifL